MKPTKAMKIINAIKEVINMTPRVIYIEALSAEDIVNSTVTFSHDAKCAIALKCSVA